MSHEFSQASYVRVNGNLANVVTIVQRRITISKLAPFLREFSEKHRAQPMTLEVLEGATWKIEQSGLPLVGLDLDTKAAAAPALEIFFGDDASGERRHLSHTVNRVRCITVESTTDAEEDRLVIEGGDGSRAVLWIAR